MELTLGAAIFAGLVSFLSPCVLPVVPAYLGQLGVTAAVGGMVGVGGGAATAGLTRSGASTDRSLTARWRVLPHAFAFVIGFGAIFTLLGLTAYTLRPIFDLPTVRLAGGIVLVLLGLNLMGILRLRLLARTWRPFDRFGERPLGGAAARTPLGALALGSIFAVGHTPCVGPTLGAILGLSLNVGAAPNVVALLVAYSLGLGIPFLALALALDGTTRYTRPFLRHGRQIELIGGALVVIIGVAIMFDWLALFANAFNFLWPRV
ncbi:MAG: cytochrome c biogenesis CcdA family protein [Chloroflexota bacterium]|nr:cytochrome c biogenesis CcdA family protein [Chloroflexota bacterium]